MSPKPRFLSTLLLTALLLLCLPFCRAEIAVTERPALHVPNAVHAWTFAATRAGNRLVVVAERGIILLSDDNGKSWRQASTPASVSLLALQFVTDQIGWAVGHFGVVLHTEDGGLTWTRQLDGKQAAQRMSDDAQSRLQQHDGNPDVLQKRLAEAQRAVAEGPDKPFLDLYFENERVGYVVGAYNWIFRTDDGGRSWQPWQSHVDNPGGFHLYAIRPAGSALFLVGEQGLLLRSLDGGANFSKMPSPYNGTYFGLLTLADGGLLAYGLRGSAFRSDDQGAHWSKVDSASQNALSAALMLQDGAVLLVSQAGEMVLSKDGGRSFQPQKIPNSKPFTGIAQAADGTIVATGFKGVATFNPASFKAQ